MEKSSEKYSVCVYFSFANHVLCLLIDIIQIAVSESHRRLQAQFISNHAYSYDEDWTREDTRSHYRCGSIWDSMKKNKCNVVDVAGFEGTYAFSCMLSQAALASAAAMVL